MAAAARNAWEEWFSPEVMFHRMIDNLRGIIEARKAPETPVNVTLDFRYWRLRVRNARSSLKQAAKQLRSSLGKTPAAMAVPPNDRVTCP